MARMRATLTRKELIMVAPGRMGYSWTTTKLRPSRKLPLMATTVAPPGRQGEREGGAQREGKRGGRVVFRRESLGWGFVWSGREGDGCDTLDGRRVLV
jgi:hypothetical protein